MTSALFAACGFSSAPTAMAQKTADLPPRHMEHLGRGVVAIHQGGGKVAVSWRMLATDPADIAFNVYRAAGSAPPVKLNENPVLKATHFIDAGANLAEPNAYFVRPIVDGKELDASKPILSALAANPPARPYIAIPLQTTAGYSPNDASVGDLDGDGEYEIVLHQAGVGRDNSQKGVTSPPILEAYKMDGTLLWRINLGRNIREGAHYTQFMVYDLDGDGRAEVVCKTADGTVDGAGAVIGDARADWRNKDGYILDGPEFLTVFDGRTGKALATEKYVPPRGKVGDWGDNYGNRVDRFLACVAYLDGVRPSVVFCRGYYTRAVLAAWNWRDGKLTNVWTFDSDDGTPGNRAYRGQGSHQLSVGDVDGDGKDDIIYGAAVIGSDGKGLYSTGFGHGDSTHFGDLDPDRPGLEVFCAHGDVGKEVGMGFRDAGTGKLLWGKASMGKAGVGRACAADIDPRHKGDECWARGEGVGGLYSAQGKKITDKSPRVCNMAIWWDGDLGREILDGVNITKWDWENERDQRLFSGADYGCVSNNGTKANPCLSADLFGDWREELVARTKDGKELRIFTTTIPTEHRFVTLMHDPIYRLGVAWQNVAYNVPPHTGFYLGYDMNPPPRPRIVTVPAR
jgi:rhamnogalacturonan endolyase